MLEQLTQKALRTLQPYLPAIQAVITEKAPVFLKTQGLKGVQFLAHPDRLRPLFETVYQSLPLPLRVLVKQDTFVQFCLDRKESLLGNWLPAPDESPAPPAPPTKAEAPVVPPKKAAKTASGPKSGSEKSVAKTTAPKRKPAAKKNDPPA